MENPNPVKTFVCYSQKDASWRDRLHIHLKPLSRKNIIEIWDDTAIEAGDRWLVKIDDALSGAGAAILLVSPNFYSSDFIHDRELPSLLTTAEERGILIIPLLLSPSLFLDDDELSQFQAISDDYLNDLTEGLQDAVFVEVATRLKKYYDENRNARSLPTQKETQAEISSADELPDRQSYVERYVALIERAQLEILILSSKFHKSETLETASRVNQALGDASNRQVTIRALLGTGFDRIPGAIELVRRYDIEVRFDPAIHTLDVNYLCVDKRHIIVATRSVDRSSQYERSSSWIEFTSRMLGRC